MSVPEDLPHGGTQEASEHPQEGSLAGSIGTGEDEGRAIVDADVDVAKHCLCVPHVGDGVEHQERRWRPHGRHFLAVSSPAKEGRVPRVPAVCVHA